MINVQIYHCLGYLHRSWVRLADFFIITFIFHLISDYMAFFFKHSKPQHLWSRKQRLTNCRLSKICMTWFKMNWQVSLIPIIHRMCEFHMMYYLCIVDAFFFINKPVYQRYTVMTISLRQYKTIWYLPAIAQWFSSFFSPVSLHELLRPGLFI